MTRNKDADLFDDSATYSRILGVDPSQVRKKIRGNVDTEDRGGLFNSTDLFGDIIDDFRSVESEPVYRVDSPPEPVSPLEQNVRVENTIERGATEAAAELLAADTAPYQGSPSPRDDQYSLLDAAYSTLLKDEKLQKDVERLDKIAAQNSERDESFAYGEYVLLDRVAAGGMAGVFRAKREGVEGFEKIVAVKRILPHLSNNAEFVEMFIAEAKIVASLTHPNIAQIFDLGKIDASYFIAMEFVEGRDLRTILSRASDRDTRLGVDLAAIIAAKVGAALEYAHRHRDEEGKELQIVHRDVSPQNILVSSEGEVKLVDFGIARAATKASHTDSGSLRGKLLYMSPEQAWGKSLDRRSDIFSLGAVFYEVLTGHPLFSGNSEISVLDRVREAQFLAPSSLNPAVPIEIEAIVTRALQKNPDERYQDAADMLLDLDTYLRKRPVVGASELARFIGELYEEN